MITSMPEHNPLFDFLNDLATHFREGKEFPSDTVDSVFGAHSIEVCVDEEDDPYLFVGFMLPDEVYAEIDSDTYGTLFGFRIYKEEA